MDKSEKKTSADFTPYNLESCFKQNFKNSDPNLEKNDDKRNLLKNGKNIKDKIIKKENKKTVKFQNQYEKINNNNIENQGVITPNETISSFEKSNLLKLNTWGLIESNQYNNIVKKEQIEYIKSKTRELCNLSRNTKYNYSANDSQNIITEDKKSEEKIYLRKQFNVNISKSLESKNQQINEKNKIFNDKKKLERLRNQFRKAKIKILQKTEEDFEKLENHIYLQNEEEIM